MLKGIPSILSPELLKVLMEMGHGDEIVLADGNFPAASHAQRLVRCDGHRIVPLLEALYPLFPLDNYVQSPIFLMQPVQGDAEPAVWKTYENMLQPYPCEQLERFHFYERAKKAYAIVATGDTVPYGNIILKKGVVEPESY
ncbi:L-fucose mutarotase [Bacillaceae bacterium SIJ1]|uniref:L-fucose mutarotase n=1 Tax=Litoribacterium kuwaitense TaxID=1398745 RepID=UPI0013EB784D|nr:L-fucose mutarotase [Litoribacterium kuwaitense]NGP45452.1 L-fucose mutarotase [Litoribacterium kuwaitense]